MKDRTDRPTSTTSTTTVSQPSRTSSRLVLAGLAGGVLSAITGVVSYQHGLDVVRMVGNAGLAAYLVPLVPDLMIVTSSLTLIEASAMKAKRPAMAVVALLAGIGWTVAMNVAAGIPDGAGGALINAGVPVAFVLTFESVLWLFRRGRAGASEAPGPATSSQCPHTVALTGDEAVVMAWRHAAECLDEALSFRELERRFGTKRDRVAELVRPYLPTPSPEPSLNGSGPQGGSPQIALKGDQE